MNIDQKNIEIQGNCFEINGFWKDDKVKFSGHLVFELECEDGEEEDEGVFYYGLSETDIQEAIKNKWDTDLEFVITSYCKL